MHCCLSRKSKIEFLLCTVWKGFFYKCVFQVVIDTIFISHLRGFSNTETLCSEYKYYCEECRSKQEAHKR